MILACPACGTRYRVDAQDLCQPSGRTVRCANCGHTWHQAPPAAEPQMAEAAPSIRSPRREPALEIALRPPEPSRLEAPPRPQPAATGAGRHRSAALAWVVPIVLVLLLGFAVLAMTVGRARVVAIWPSAGRLYAWIGRPAAPSGPGLVIGKIAPTRTTDGLTIAGEIVNLGNTPRDVPRLRLALQDAAGKEVQSEIVDPPKARLLPGEVAHFATPFPHPVDAATGVVATFVSP